MMVIVGRLSRCFVVIRCLLVKVSGVLVSEMGRWMLMWLSRLVK